GSTKALTRIAEALSACGVPFEFLHAHEAQERWPGMRFASPVVFQPDAGRINAELTVATLLAQAVHYGAEVHVDERVSAIHLRADGERATVSTPLGVYDTRRVVAT